MRLDVKLRSNVDFSVLTEAITKNVQESLEEAAKRIQQNSGADEVIYGINKVRIVNKNGKEKEFGTLNNPPRPTLYPAMLNEEESLISDIEERIRRDIK